MRCISTGTTVWNTISRRVAGVALFLAGAALQASERIEALEPHMGTMFRIVLYADDAAAAHVAIRAAFDRVGELDGELSDYIPDSELNRVCTTAVDRDVRISDDLYTVLKASQALAERTGGAFDVTLGPVIRLWRKARQTGQLPTADELAEAARRSGYRSLHLGNGTVRLDIAGMQLDLGAIAKGYAADEGLRVLREHGFPQALVAASGDIAFGDSPPGKAGWETGVDSINASSEGFTEVVALHNAAISTSGDTEQYVDIGGVRYSHIINPTTGKGLTHRIGVTVIAAKGIDSDGLSTAASVITEQAGAEAALAFIAKAGARGIIVVQEAGEWKKYAQ
jgi:FAD:protein FMN transferase